MTSDQESLFSLEVVVEKLYLPYVTCRFPAVAFRLLDFPTILISHVETELASRIRKKINIDPYYQMPNQFADLQDKHGNFQIKKGKSCLFKISVETLAMHLENTPMYIMVIDEFPDVPKLLGNSSLAMNEIMDGVKSDIRKNGMTVPSVQGDKGLFKIYSLMGKEIGYMIVGFRLLSLGPGLIGHLPTTAIAKRASDKKQVHPKSVVEEVIESKTQKVQSSQVKKSRQETKKAQNEMLNNTKEMGSMTDVEKCDALMQTVDMIDENIHVTVSEKDKKDLKTIETQTEYIRQYRKAKKEVKISEKLKFTTEESEDSDDGLAINQHIACPPPLFYNKNAEPEIEIERDINAFHSYNYAFDDATIDDLSEDEHIVETSDKVTKSSHPRKQQQEINYQLNDARTVVISNVKKEEKKGPLFQIQNGVDVSGNAFPILNALLQELSKIQSPQLQNATVGAVKEEELVNEVEKTKVQETKTVKTKSNEQKKDTINEANASRQKAKAQAKPDTSQGGQKQKGWIRKAPEAGIKKTKLVFGLTNTQRLRLAKQNPGWLKTAEQNEKVAKAQRQKNTKPKDTDADLDTGNLSDTFTEVRRLAAAELENTTMALNAKVERVRKFKKKRAKSRENSPSKNRSTRERSVSPKTKPRGRKVKKQELSNTGDSTELEKTDEFEGQGMSEQKPDSVADSIPSSRIEVRIPSAVNYDSEEHENTFTDSFEDIDTGTDRRSTKSKFPGFNSGDNLPDSIMHDGNTSINSTQLDDDSPLESTRVSKQFRTMPGDTLFKSTEDYSTRQFQSTDEPELQKLMSEDEKSDSGITPVTDRSIRSPSPAPPPIVNNSARLSMKFEVINPTASQQSPLPALRRSQQLKVDSFSARPTPTDTVTPRSRSSQSSPKIPTPRTRKPLRERRLDFKKDSIHTESVSSYVPSESENILSLISDGSYSDDFHMSSERDLSSRLSTPELPKVSNSPRFIPSTKLGFTIH